MPARPQTHYARGQARRAKLVEAAIEVIAERGLEGVTHRSVAARAGVPLSTTSYFFGSLDELIGAAVTEIADRVRASVDAVVADAAGGALDRRELAERLVRLLAAASPQLVLVQFEAYLATSRRPDLRPAVRAIMLGFEEATAAALAAVGVADAPGAARQFVAVIDGFALHRIAWPRDDEDADALASALTRLLESYLSASG
ncbi:TetR/AcrR family transcriptional regulator [Nocardioides ferulae]|uniref:TetR/AcrR family transcriptional regulator n=1 Tax=Nocardioides ferulae TaxID=2340821 RepID=UPI000EB4BF5D|nr:TetR family transcriptional regulator [Nocardioides ferulae]